MSGIVSPTGGLLTRNMAMHSSGCLLSCVQRSIALQGSWPYHLWVSLLVNCLHPVWASVCIVLLETDLSFFLCNSMPQHILFLFKVGFTWNIENHLLFSNLKSSQLSERQNPSACQIWLAVVGTFGDNLSHFLLSFLSCR